MARFWLKTSHYGTVMAVSYLFMNYLSICYQYIWVNKLCAKFGRSRILRTVNAPHSKPFATSMILEKHIFAICYIADSAQTEYFPMLVSKSVTFCPSLCFCLCLQTLPTLLPAGFEILSGLCVQLIYLLHAPVVVAHRLAPHHNIPLTHVRAAGKFSFYYISLLERECFFIIRGWSFGKGKILV